MQGVAAVVQPALMEEQPRRLLAALAAGAPVIATPGCGLAPDPNLTLVAPGDLEGLIAALRARLD
jgi:glycosyltransferase involved in cell wall biosynthesis